MGFIVPLLFFVFLTIFVMAISKQSFGACVPIALLLSALIPYITGVVFGSLAIGFWLDVALAVLGLALMSVSAIRDRDGLLKSIPSSGLLLFLILYLAVYATDLYRGFFVWDEFSHWGIMVKDLLSLDKLYCVPEAALVVHRDYPPFMPIFEYVYCRLSGGYEEAYVYRALHLLLCSLCLLPIYCTKHGEKSFAKTAAICLSMVGAICIFLLSADYDTIYLDLPLGVLAGICLYAAAFLNPFKRFDAACLVVLLSAVVLTKQIGAFFYALAVIMLATRGLCWLVGNKAQGGKRLEISKRLSSLAGSERTAALHVICALIIPIVFFLSWTFYTQQYPVDRQFDTSQFSLSHAIAVFSDSSSLEQWKREGFWNCARFLYRFPLVDSSPIELTYVRLMLCVTAIAVVAAFVVRRRDPVRFKRLLLVALVVFAGSVLYGVILCFSYTFGFTEGETARVASGDRYALTYVIASLLVAYFSIVTCIFESDPRAMNVSAFLLILLSVFLLVPKGHLAQLIPDQHSGSFSLERSVASTIEEATEPDASTSILLGDGSRGQKYEIAYYAHPRSIMWNTFADKGRELAIDDVDELLSGFDYVYVIDPEVDDLAKYPSLFDGEGPIESGLYSIDRTDGQVHLSLIAPGEE